MPLLKFKDEFQQASVLLLNWYIFTDDLWHDQKIDVFS